MMPPPAEVNNEDPTAPATRTDPRLIPNGNVSDPRLMLNNKNKLGGAKTRRRKRNGRKTRRRR
jgi:hypothetical protein